MPQILIRARGVADMKLHGLAGPHEVADGDRAAFRIRSDHIADEKVASRELLLVFANDNTDV